MRDRISSNMTHKNQEIENILPQNIEDYAEILEFFGIAYERVNYYLQVGEIKKIQGWIIHISVVISQVKDLLEKVIPILVAENVSFKVAENREMAKNILGGNLGIEQLGKIISVYPDNDEKALRLGIKLVASTQSFNGPSILTDVYLGGAIYTRYGSISPIILSDISGKRSKYIYTHAGELIKDPYSIPFQMPEGIRWPFSDLCNPIVSSPKKNLKGIYKPLSLLKEDIKGNVYKGIYLKSLFRISNCVIKQGKKHASSDDQGRDIHDRLAWQFELHQDLTGIVPIPATIDFFQENGDSYLVMEFIKGISLYDYLKKINLNIKCWIQVTIHQKLILLNFLLQIISIIEKLHQKGYVHRDIAPGNFLIDDKGNITVIDMELAYSISRKKPNPAFVTGTPGYISPEQQNNNIPTFKDDCYGLGALMLTIFTGVYPMKFDTQDPQQLVKNLKFFIDNDLLSELVTSCLSHNEVIRPNVDVIRSGIEKYKKDIELSAKNDNSKSHISKLDKNRLKEIIQWALNGLTIPPIVISEDLWFSKLSKNENGSAQKGYTLYGGMYEGISGVLYLLARAKISGYDVEFCKINYNKGWKFIEEEYFNYLPNITPGLYGGAAGMAVSLAEGIRSSLLEDNPTNWERIFQCLTLPNITLDLATGLSGQGIAILQCNKYLGNKHLENLLNPIIDTLINTQQKDGSWLLHEATGNNIPKKKIGFAYGIAGITWFLLEFISCHKDMRAENAVLKAMNWLLKTTHDLKGLFQASVFNKVTFGERENGDERKGIILTFIKAYEILKNNYYKKISENVLAMYPTNIVKNNFDLDTGLAGLGEIYIEAFRVFNNIEWRQRAEWIAQVYLHTYVRSSTDAIHWKMDEFDEPTADLMTGNSGVIHFLFRLLNTEKIGYRMLS